MLKTFVKSVVSLVLLTTVALPANAEGLQSTIPSGDLDLSPWVGAYLNSAKTTEASRWLALTKSPEPLSEFYHLSSEKISPELFILINSAGTWTSEADTSSVELTARNERIISKKTFRSRSIVQAAGVTIEAHYALEQESCTLDLSPHPLNKKDSDPNNDDWPCADRSTSENWNGNESWDAEITLVNGSSAMQVHEIWSKEKSAERGDQRSIFLK